MAARAVCSGDGAEAVSVRSNAFKLQSLVTWQVAGRLIFSIVKEFY